jgi:hypothetical protein
LSYHFPIRPEFVEFLAGLVLGSLFLARSNRPGWLRFIRTIARRRTMWIMIAAILGPSIRLAILPLAPIPYPTLHDEFGHLLGADTLQHGRLANPPLPLSDHFETIYVLQKPVYAATYPLGNAAFQAIGWKLTGQPWLGVWLSVVLCCAAIAWCLYRWVPPVAAWAAGLLCSLHLGISSSWMNTYWQGTVPAAGGALVLGALPLLYRTGRIKYAGIAGIGWTLIFFTRPYESILAGVTIAITVLVRRRLGVIAVLTVIVLIDLCGYGYHNWRVTGDPLLHPYQLSQLQYGVPHALLWQKEILEPPRLTAQQRGVFLWQQSNYRAGKRLATHLLAAVKDWKGVWSFYIGYPLTIPFAVAIVGFRSWKVRVMLAGIAVSLAWSFCYPETKPHYLAPVAPFFFAVSARGLLKIAYWRRGSFLAIAFLAGSALFGTRILFTGHPPAGRAVIARQLKSMDGKQLVFVHYAPGHDPHDEWVYNRAVLDEAKVVWANDLGRERNRDLMRYFKDRQAWLVEPDEHGRFIPYPLY